MSYDERSFSAGRQQGREDREGECQYLRAEIKRLQAALAEIAPYLDDACRAVIRRALGEK